MSTNQLIDEIREVRHRISEQFDHDTRKLGEHYQQLEATKYANRNFVKAGVLVHLAESSHDLQAGEKHGV